MTTTRGIDFKTLTLKDALDLAVLVEEEARDRYADLADQLELHHTPEAAGFFRYMSGIEEKHRSQLAVRRTKLFADAPVSVSRDQIFDIEAPEYDQARAFMTVRQALMTALVSEVKAHDFFVSAIPHLGDKQAIALFEELRDEEVEHQALVKKEMAKHGPDLNADATVEYGDPPVQQ